ncbi:reticulon family protein [Artemisia annua]|uniref:Reticulon family protein n=1 Tax=Artemisia annua TaxID=35608 RepID=A0A2U1NQU6_ARTAN|nr:reticulon family protein [Artemisia annua]
MTLKVAPLLLLGSEYGHIVSFRKLCALGFFIGFTGSELCSLYLNLICKKGKNDVIQAHFCIPANISELGNGSIFVNLYVNVLIMEWKCVMINESISDESSTQSST